MTRVAKLLIMGDSAVRLLATWSALRVVKSCQKDCPTAKVLLEAVSRTVPELTV